MSDAPNIISMTQARRVGLASYFTGKPCKRGHVTMRYISDRSCVICRALTARAWQRQNRESENERMRRQRAANPAASRAATAKWRADNPEIFRKSYSAFRKNNLLKCRAAVARWANLNRQQIRAIAHARRCRQLAAPGRFTAQDIVRIKRQQHSRCAYCRYQLIGTNFHIDHIQPLACGGTNWPRNLQLLCQHCNASKWCLDPIVFARRQGFLL